MSIRAAQNNADRHRAAPKQRLRTYERRQEDGGAPVPGVPGLGGGSAPLNDSPPAQQPSPSAPAPAPAPAPSQPADNGGNNGGGGGQSNPNPETPVAPTPSQAPAPSSVPAPQAPSPSPQAPQPSLAAPSVSQPAQPNTQPQQEYQPPASSQYNGGGQPQQGQQPAPSSSAPAYQAPAASSSAPPQQQYGSSAVQQGGAPAQSAAQQGSQPASAYEQAASGQAPSSSTTVAPAVVATTVVDGSTLSTTLSPPMTSRAAVPSVSRGIGVAAATSTAADGSIFVGGNAVASEKMGLSAGGIAGIVVACLVVLAMIAGVLVKRKKKADNDAAGGTRQMSEYYDGDMLTVPGQAGFVTFRDNASARTSYVSSPTREHFLSSAPAAESPDDDDASHYDNDNDNDRDGVDGGYDLGRPAYHDQHPSSYYTAAQAPYSSQSLRMPEYSLPSPPIPALDRDEAALYGSDARYLAAGATLSRSRSERSIASSQRSYVDEQLKDLYVHQY